MLALVDYPSDDDSSDAADNKPKQQTVIIPSATTQMQPHAAVLSAPQPKPALPDAASLFSSSTDSSIPWAANRQGKRLSTAAQGRPAKAVKTAANMQSKPQQELPAYGLLLPPQLRGRANASTEDMERLGFAKNKAAQRPKTPQQ